MENHEPFLREAIALSKSAMERGDEPFGSVLVKDDEVILRARRLIEQVLEHGAATGEFRRSPHAFAARGLTSLLVHTAHVQCFDRSESKVLSNRWIVFPTRYPAVAGFRESC